VGGRIARVERATGRIDQEAIAVALEKGLLALDRGVDVGELVESLEEHRALVGVDLHPRCLRCHTRREREFPALETLVHDRESAAREHQQLHLRASPVDEDEEVTGHGIGGERAPHIVRQTLESVRRPASKPSRE